MKKIITSLLVAWLALGSPKAFAQTGTWKNYMAYYDITEIEQYGNELFILASDNLYTYNRTDKSITTYDRVNGLSDCGISHIGWNNQAKQLVIIYSNGNIDLMDSKGNIINLPEYYSKSITGDKTIYSLYMQNEYAYLATGFGIIKLNVSRQEISDTYNLGFRVDYSYISGNNIYAASSTNGLYSAALSSNLLDKNNWSRVGDYTPQSKTIDADLLAEAQTLSPGGPKVNYFGFMRFLNNKLYTASGTVRAEFPGTIQVFDGTNWSFSEPYADINKKTGYRFSSIYSFDVDPKDENHMYVGTQSGLYEFNNLKFTTVYNKHNSPLMQASTVDGDNPNYVIVTDTKFDTSGNLWVFNSISPSTSMFKFSSDKQWTSLHKSELMAEEDRSMEDMTSTFFDSRNLMWFVNNMFRTPALVCYQPSTDAIKVYKNFVNEDGTTVSVTYVRCVAEDKDHNIWIGTDVGPLELTADKIGSNDDVFTQVKVPRNDGTNLADYLMDGIDIKCMVIDGGGRKWFGTSDNGLYLISADNMTQLQHFTVSNSKLLSNTISSLALNPGTGELFIGTDKGLCSYMSDASEPVEKMDKDVTYAYPNPVKPGYTGPITITGLSYDADVKIVTVNGTLVAQGRSNGGSFVWDGNDLNGKRVASGVYMVETATSDGQSGTVCKIAVVN